MTDVPAVLASVRDRLLLAISAYERGDAHRFTVEIDQATVELRAVTEALRDEAA